MKSKTKLFTLVFFLLVSFSSFSQMKKVTSVEGISEYTLEQNNLRVLLFPDQSSQTITVNITYLVGSRHEGYGEKGMAHLLEHMVFKGTPNHKDIPKELSSHGARPNGTTWYDRTNYFETFNATDENLDWALDLEADRMVNSYIAKKDLESEFTVVRNEFERGENSPTSVLMKNVISSAYLWHNYGQSTIGNRSDIERVPIDNLKAFYKKYYRPDNAILMVTGKFDTEKTLKLIEKKFGVIKNPAHPLKYVPTIEPPQDGEKRVDLERVGDLQVLSSLYHIPAGSDVDYAAIIVVENILTDEPSGRLYKALVDKQKAATLWSFSPFTKEPSFLYINVDVPSDKSLEEAETILKNEIDNLAQKPITADELKRAKANLLKQTDQIMRNSAFLGTYMSEFIGAGDWRLAYILRDRIENVTLDQVNKAAQKYLIPTNGTIGNFKPTKDPKRVEIGHVEDLASLVNNYKGKKDLGTGEAFDVDYDAISSRLHTGTIPQTAIEYGFITKKNRGNTVNLSFSFRNGNLKDLTNISIAPGYTARMLNKGTQNFSRQEIEDKLSELKSSISFRGNAGRTYVSINSTEEKLPETLKLMVEILKNPSFDSAEFEKLKTEDLANLEKNKSEPNSLVSRRLSKINEKFPKGHPYYSNSIEEQIEAIKNLTIADLKSYYNNFYGLSNNSILIAIGNIDEDMLKGFFSENFKDFKSSKPFTKIRNSYTKSKIANENILTPDKKNAISLGLLAIECSQYDSDYPALEIASSIFGGGFLNSRIAERLRQKDGVSYSAGGRIGVDGEKNDRNSIINVYAIFAPQNLDKVLLGFKEEIQRFIDGGITEEELTDAVNGWVQAKSVSRAKDGELSSLINNNIYYKRDLSFQKDIEAQVKKLKVADINKVIKKYFKPFDQWTVVNGGDFNKE